ncbi:hypothetical protein [uncultured Rikenella sp.]|uniref:hypothetical protein n=2 Tax=uncultured Rikenella sp. TaxID=368003 RepID=UPI00261A9DAF|nr:hypothetical protein [uncultured Rikenella sp.]
MHGVDFRNFEFEIFSTFTPMRRLSIYISLVCVALLVVAGATRVVSAAGRLSVPVAVDSALLTADDSATGEGYILPLTGEGDAFSRGLGGVRTGLSEARCFWLTGMRRALRSPVFQSTDLFLTYLGRASAARAFAAWRMSLCGNACGAAVAVSRAGDGCVYALRRIVI